jgi:hypothetical protein
VFGDLFRGHALFGKHMKDFQAERVGDGFDLLELAKHINVGHINTNF